MNIVLTGPPGCGKTTQAARLVEKFGLEHLSTGEMLRGEVAKGSAIGKQAADIMTSGELVPDELIIAMVEPRIAAAAERGGYLLDGYPRSLPQAEALLAGPPQVHPAVAIVLFVPEPVLVERILERADGEKRADDTPDAVANRLRVYQEATRPVHELFARHNLLQVINAQDTPDEVAEAILGRIPTD